MSQPFAWCSDVETRRTVFVEIEGESFGYKFVGYDSRELPAVEYRFNVNGILKAEGYAGQPTVHHVVTLVGFALLRRRYRQNYMTQRHCRTCCC